MSDAAASPAHWGSPLGRWLRGVVCDSASVLPSLEQVIESVRLELVSSEVLGVVFVRPEYWGRASELFTWRELEDVYRSLSQAVLDLVGKDLRRIDLASDLGLYGEGLAVILSAPRERQAIALSEVEAVAERTALALREGLGAALPARLVERFSVEVGAALFYRPEPEQTLEDVLVGGLVEAEQAARAKQRGRLGLLGEELRAALEQSSLGVLFQPVVDLARGEIAGFDAVVQGPSLPSLRSGDVILDVARRTGQTFRAFDAYHEAALRLSADRVRGKEFVMLRVAASELLESSVRVMSHLYNRESTLAPSNIMFMVGIGEVLEHIPSSVVAMRSVSDMGFQLALDIPADGPLSLDHLREFDPDLLRISGRTIRRLDEHQDEFELVLMLARFATRHGMRLLAADCEERGELLGLRRAAVHLAQGDFFAPYTAEISRPRIELP
jgi:EAL domain-containing protein (putative c-di-GMP-specific phosphodiesterase class I)